MKFSTILFASSAAAYNTTVIETITSCSGGCTHTSGVLSSVNSTIASSPATSAVSSVVSSAPVSSLSSSIAATNATNASISIFVGAGVPVGHANAYVAGAAAIAAGAMLL